MATTPEWFSRATTTHACTEGRCAPRCAGCVMDRFVVHKRRPSGLKSVVLPFMRRGGSVVADVRAGNAGSRKAGPIQEGGGEEKQHVVAAAPAAAADDGDAEPAEQPDDDSDFESYWASKSAVREQVRARRKRLERAPRTIDAHFGQPKRCNHNNNNYDDDGGE